jgi:hypothetical protein
VCSTSRVTVGSRQSGRVLGYLDGRRRAFLVRRLVVYCDDGGVDIDVDEARAGCSEGVDEAREIEGCMSSLFR